MDRRQDLAARLGRAPSRVAVVGGGWAGLAAAVELATAGVNVTVFEAGRQLGGRARRVDLDGLALDNGQHILLGAYAETLRLMRRVGVDPERALRRLPLAIDYPGAGFRLALPRLPAPLHLAAGLLSANGARLGDKIAAARFMTALRRTAYRLPEDTSVAELLDRHGQHGVIRSLLWEALCFAALNTPPAAASAQVFANVLRDSLGGDRAATDLLLPADDLGALFPDAAARYITAHGGELRLGTRVEAIGSDLSIAGTPYDHVIVATAPQHAAPLLAPHPAAQATAEALAALAYEPIATLYAAYPADLRLPAPMIGLAGGLGQWAFDRGQLGGPAGLLSFVLSAHGTWEALDNDALGSALHDELAAALGRTLPRPAWRRVIREQRATFACRPGLVRPPTQTARAGLWLAGDHVASDYPATLESAVRSGVAAAAGILGHPAA